MLRAVCPTIGVTRSQRPRVAANRIIHGCDPHAGTVRYPASNRDLVVFSASLPNPGALVLRAAVYRKQDAIGSVQHASLLLDTTRGNRRDVLCR
jgi:hypothetical protein